MGNEVITAEQARELSGNFLFEEIRKVANEGGHSIEARNLSESLIKKLEDSGYKVELEFTLLFTKLYSISW